MAKKISKYTRRELLEALNYRYLKATKKDKTRILDEFAAVTGYNRKYAVRLLGGKTQVRSGKAKPDQGRRIYNEAVKEALIIAWETSDRICSKRLKAILPDLVDAMERHGHIKLDLEVRNRLFLISAAKIDRLLADIRPQTGSRKKRRRNPKKVSKQIPISTFADKNEPSPGYFEIDFVVHGGGSMAGSFIHTLVATDVSSGWIECVPLLAREQSLVVEALEILRRQLPIPMLGIDSDNDSAFINDTLLSYCRNSNIKFTRSRPFCSNDQARVEQKNGAVVRRFVGYERFSGVIAGQALASLYQIVRLYVNYFQPSFKLRKKERDGSKVNRYYHKPLTPCHSLCNNSAVMPSIKEKLKLQRIQLDPVYLLHRIRDNQAALAALVSPEDYTGPGRNSLEKFLKELPKLWRLGEVRPTHRKNRNTPRYWRTRKDPFENVWTEILQWLQITPDITAKLMFERLQVNYPGRFPDCQLRTLQRRVKEWRQIMARKLVYSCLEEKIEYAEASPVGVDRGC